MDSAYYGFQLRLPRVTSGRTVAQLKKKWENVKSEAKKAASDRKKEQFKTAGGQVKSETTDEIMVIIICE